MRQFYLFRPFKLTALFIKRLSLLIIIFFLINPSCRGQDLTITGVFDADLGGGVPKGIEIYVINNITDLSIYGLGSANNGGGSDGEEFTFPPVPAVAGDYIYIASESPGFTSFFEFTPNFISYSSMSINGDDAIELFMNGNVIDLFGNINQDGTGQPWEYLDGWAYRNSLGPNETFNASDWVFSGINALDTESKNSGATIPFPIATFESSTLSVVKNQIEGFTMYPNPVSNGNLYVKSNSVEVKKIEIYSVNGEQLYKSSVKSQESMNISKLKSGIYYARIIEEDKIATRKLIVH